MKKIIAKASSDHQIEDRKQKGADGIEWQILKNSQQINNYTLTILSVHTILEDNTEVAIDECFYEYTKDKEKSRKRRQRIIEAFQMAEEIARIQNHRVLVVVHLNQVIIPNTKLLQFINQLFFYFPNTDLAIENTTLIHKDLIYRTGADPDSVPIFVRLMRELLNTNRIYSVIDICHALGSIREKDFFFHMKEDELKGLENYLIKTAPYCKIVHFNYLKNIGYGQDHGTVFTDEAIKRIFPMIEKYVPDANFVIEVREENYLNALNFKKTVNQLKKFF